MEGVRGAQLELLAQIFGGARTQTVEDVVVAFLVALYTYPGLLQQIVRDVATADQELEEKDYH